MHEEQSYLEIPIDFESHRGPTNHNNCGPMAVSDPDSLECDQDFILINRFVQEKSSEVEGTDDGRQGVIDGEQLSQWVEIGYFINARLHIIV